METVQVGTRMVGAGRPCFLVAEIGINHNGDMARARQAIDAAAEAGADSVKFQNFRADDFVPDRSLTYTYVSGGREVTESQYNMFKRCELSRDSVLALKSYCDRRGILFHCTPMDSRGLQDLVDAGVVVLKNGSDCLTHLPLIRAMSRTGLPTALATGMATLGEIDEAVRAFREAGSDRLVLLHCTSSYPTPPEDTHLRKIPALAAVFGCPVGLSDHTEGTVAAVGAVALGACWIEKHFTLDKGLPGPDHRFSSDPAEFQALVGAVRTVEKNLGAPVVGPTAAEEQGRREYRLSCAAARDLPPGHVLAEADLMYRRPADGLRPAEAGGLIGRRLRQPLRRGQSLTWDALIPE